MLGYLGYRAARGQWRLYQRSRKAPGGKWTWQAVVLTVLVFTVLWMLTAPFQHQGVLFWALAGVNSLLTGTLFVPRMLNAVGDRRIMRQLGAAAQERRAPDPMAPSALRAHADVLDALEQASPSRPELTASWQQDPEPDPEEAERARRVADLFSVECRVCKAPETVACSPGIGIPHLMVSREPTVEFCHWARILDAVDFGTASKDEVEAQLGFKLEGSLQSPRRRRTRSGSGGGSQLPGSLST